MSTAQLTRLAVHTGDEAHLCMWHRRDRGGSALYPVGKVHKRRYADITNASSMRSMASRSAVGRSTRAIALTKIVHGSLSSVSVHRRHGSRSDWGERSVFFFGWCLSRPDIVGWEVSRTDMKDYS